MTFIIFNRNQIYINKLCEYSLVSMDIISWSVNL